MKKCLTIILVLFTAVLLTSCENFLNGSDLKDQIEKEILIAKSTRPEITSANPNYVEGGVYSDSNKTE